MQKAGGMRKFGSKLGSMDRGSRRAAILLFWIGVFSMTQIRLVGKIGISEAVMTVIGPFLFFKDIEFYKRDGALPYFTFLILWILGALFSDLINHSPFIFMAKGLSAPIVMFGVSVCLYRLLRRNPLAHKWFFLGVAISMVISVFVFQRGVAGDMADSGDFDGAVERVVGYKLFWAGQLSLWLTLPVRGWYLSVPKAYSFGAVLFLAAYNLLTGARSFFLCCMFSALLIFIGGKHIRDMARVKRMFLAIMIILACVGMVAKSAYKYAASHGFMGEEEQAKYEKQSEKGSGALSMLMAGRSEFFVGAFAALDRPLVGFGSHALDFHGYWMQFVQKYGDSSDVEARTKAQRKADMKGGFTRIPAHSHIICFWMWHGVFGLLFWLYVMVLTIRTLQKRMSVMPEYFGYLALAIPGFMWNVMFSPLGDRVPECFMFCALLLLKKIARDQRNARRIMGA